MFHQGDDIWNFQVFDGVQDLCDFARDESFAKGKYFKNAKRLADQLEQSYNSPFAERQQFQDALGQIAELQKNIDLGGALKKARLEITDNPSGIFDFGLASLGLIRLSEFYCEEIFKKYPAAFQDLGLPVNVVPDEEVIQNENKDFFVKYTAPGSTTPEYFACEKRQKGTTALTNAFPDIQLTELDGMILPENYRDKNIARNLGFTSNFKKSYIQFSRAGGTVPYLDIIVPVQFVGGGGGALGQLQVQLPAIVLSQFLNAAGVRTRIYATRAIIDYERTTSPWDGTNVRGQRSEFFEGVPQAFTNARTGQGISIEDTVPKFWATARPRNNRLVCLKIKDRDDHKLPLDEIGNIFTKAMADFNETAWYRTQGVTKNQGNMYVGFVTYAYPTAMNWQFTYWERWAHWCSKNKYFGNEYVKYGWRMPESLGRIPAPYGRVIPTCGAYGSYDWEADSKNGTLMDLTHPFGFNFYHILDQAELSLGTDLSTIINRIYKRWREQGFDDANVKAYVKFLAQGALGYRGNDPTTLFQLEWGPQKMQPMQFVPDNPDQTKKYGIMNDNILRELTNLLNRLK